MCLGGSVWWTVKKPNMLRDSPFNIIFHRLYNLWSVGSCAWVGTTGKQSRGRICWETVPLRSSRIGCTICGQWESCALVGTNGEQSRGRICCETLPLTSSRIDCTVICYLHAVGVGGCHRRFSLPGAQPRWPKEHLRNLFWTAMIASLSLAIGQILLGNGFWCYSLKTTWWGRYVILLISEYGPRKIRLLNQNRLSPTVICNSTPTCS